MSAIQYLVQAHTKPLFKMDWSNLFARVIQSMASPNLIEQLCQPRDCVEIEQSMTSIPTITVSSKITITSIIAQVSPTTPRPIVVPQNHAIFNNLPGLAMHPLTFLFGLAVILAFITFGSFGVCMYKVRSNRKAVQAIKVVVAIASAELERDKATALARETQLLEEISLYQEASSQPNVAVQNDNNSVNARIQDLATQLSTSINEAKDLERKNAQLTIEKDAITCNYTSTQQQFATELANAESEIQALKERNTSLLFEHTKNIEALKSQLVQQFGDTIVRLEAEKEALVTEHTTSLQCLKRKVTDAAADTARLETEKQTLISEPAESSIHLNKELIDTIGELGELQEKNRRLEDDNSNADFEKADLVIDIRDLNEEKQSLLPKIAKLEQTVNQKIIEASADNARFEAEKNSLVTQHASVLQILEEKLVNATATVTQLQSEKDALVSFEASYEQLIKNSADAQDEASQLKGDNTRLRKDLQGLNREKEQAIQALHDAVKEKDQIQESLKNVSRQNDSLLTAILTKDNEIASLQATNRVLDDDAKNFAQGRRDIRYREKRVQDQLTTLRANNADLQDRIKQNAAEVATSRKELADKTSALAITQMNFDFVNGRYEDAKMTIEQLRSDKSDITNAVMTQVAKDLGVTSLHIELVDSPKRRNMTSKAISARLRAADKMLNLGANRIKLPTL